MIHQENNKNIAVTEAKDHIAAGQGQASEADLLAQAKDALVQQITEAITRLNACNVKLS